MKAIEGKQNISTSSKHERVHWQHSMQTTIVLWRFSDMRSHSDSALKQILLTMNEKQGFIIEDLDDFHVVIKADKEYRVRQEVEVEVRGQRPLSEDKDA